MLKNFIFMLSGAAIAVVVILSIVAVDAERQNSSYFNRDSITFTNDDNCLTNCNIVEFPYGIMIKCGASELTYKCRDFYGKDELP